MKISSLSNPRIKNLVKLRERKYRKDQNLSIVEGAREVRSALKGSASLKEVFVCPSILCKQADEKGIADFLAKARSRGIGIFEVSEAVFEKISFGDRQEGLLATFEPVLIPLRQMRFPRRPLFVIVEHVEKPGNLGAIARTCDGAGVDALIISDPRVDVFNPNGVRASLGTIFSVPLAQAKAEDIIQLLKEKEVRIIATSPVRGKKYTDVSYVGPTAIVMGAEQSGLSKFWLEQAHERVLIPMRGEADSLNVSVAAALIVYEALRQRGN